MDFWLLLIVDPGNTGLLEVMLELRFLAALDNRLVPRAIDESRSHQLADILVRRAKQFYPHIANYYKINLIID